MNKLAWLSDVTIRKPFAVITDADVDNVIAQLRQQRTRWIPVKRAARLGDRVSLVHTMSYRGQTIERRKTGLPGVVLGEGAFHKRIERRILVGTRKGDNATAMARLPRDFADKELAGKRVTYEIENTGVSRPVLPQLDWHFAQELGLARGGAKTLRKEIRAIMQREADALTKRFVRAQVWTALLSRFPVRIGKEEIEGELEGRASESTGGNEERFTRSAQPSENVELDEALARLSLILRDIVRDDELRIDTERLLIASKALALRDGDPGVAFRNLFKDFETRSRVEAELLEDQAVDHLLERAQVKEEPMRYDALLGKERSEGPASQLAGHPIIQLRHENKCSFCAKSWCCTYITQRIPTPRSKRDFSHLLWQISHENVEVFKDKEGWHLLIQTSCSHLQIDGRCGIYDERPTICRDYSVENCEFSGSAERELHFRDYVSLLKYCRKRFRKWDVTMRSVG